MKKILTVWLVKSGDRTAMMHNVAKFTYAHLRFETPKSKTQVIEFNYPEGGYWPASDYVYLGPEHTEQFWSWMTSDERKFAEKNGVYAMYIKPVRVPAGKVKVV